jgi:hypothetical protein
MIRLALAVTVLLLAAAPARAAYEVGAADSDITPVGVVNLGGNGLGDGSVIPQELIGRGGMGETRGERIRSRALVVDDGKKAVAIASIETQGMFAAYEDGPYGLNDMARAVAARIPDLPVERILIAADHTHSGPDTIGVWGGVTPEYMQSIHDKTVDAIVRAYEARRPAKIIAGRSDARDLIYNQSCTEALNQSREPAYAGPDVCATPGTDGMFRVVQARDEDGVPIVTFAAYAAHATAGGGNGLHGDWPQFLSEEMAKEFGGSGLAMVGALGGTQPCRTACAFTKPTNPGYDIPSRREAYMANYMAHVRKALASAKPVRGPVGGAQRMIREPITGPAVLGLFIGGHRMGARLMRSGSSPWIVGNTIRTVASAIRIGGLAIIGTPGEGFPSIRSGVQKALDGERDVIQLGLANDQLGYLIAPTRYVPIIAAEAAVNDNIIFNVSPTIGDHVQCSDTSLALSLGFAGALPAKCLGFEAQDSSGDPVGQIPVGAPRLP